MKTKTMRIAVSGMHRGENPQPGSSIAEAIRRQRPDAFIVGLVYDAYESGIYAPDGPNVCHAMPYPTAGLATYLARLREIHLSTPFDLMIPTLDAEIYLLAGATDQLADLGIRAVLPDPVTLARCGKAKLSRLAAACDVAVPLTAVTRDLTEALDLVSRVAEQALPSGVLAEQLNAITGEPLSVSPLTWSHATYITTIHRLLRRLAEQGTPPAGQAVLPTDLRSADWITGLYHQACDSIHGICEI